MRRAPRPIAQALDALTGRLAPATLLARVQEIWPQAAGATIAAQALPVAERGGVVTVSCSSSVWAQELELMTAELVESINSLLGAEEVRQLRCRVDRDTG